MLSFDLMAELTMVAVVRTGYTRLLRSFNLSIVPQKSSRPVTLT
jgi:hypothetical protein